MPPFTIRFRRFTSLNTTIRLREGQIHVSLSDLLEGAPESVLRAIAHILLAKLYKKEIDPARTCATSDLLSAAVVRQMELVRGARGNKRFTGPEGRYYHLDEVFDALNVRFFGGLLGRPELTWSEHTAKRSLGHYDAAHNTIVVSRVFDRPSSPRYAIEYLLYHEMLHLKHPVPRTGCGAAFTPARSRRMRRGFRNPIASKPPSRACSRNARQSPVSENETKTERISGGRAVGQFEHLPFGAAEETGSREMNHHSRHWLPLPGFSPAPARSLPVLSRAPTNRTARRPPVVLGGPFPECGRDEPCARQLRRPCRPTFSTCTKCWPGTRCRPSAPTRVEITGHSAARASRIFSREPPPIRKGTTISPH